MKTKNGTKIPIRLNTPSPKIEKLKKFKETKHKGDIKNASKEESSSQENN